MRIRKFPIIFFFFGSFSTAGDVQFSGPLLPDAALTVAPHHFTLTINEFNTQSSNIYDDAWQNIKTLPNGSTQLLLDFTYGLTDHIDAELVPIFMRNYLNHKNAYGVGDFEAILGFQILTQENDRYAPDFRLTLGEIFPSGKYDYLLTANDGTDAFGMGSYQTVLGLNFERLFPLKNTHFFNLHLSLDYVYASRVNLQGINAYGGTPLSSGTVKPGSAYITDLSGEYSFNANWVMMLELYYQYQQEDRYLSNRDRIPEIGPKRPPGQTPNFFPNRHNIGSKFLEALRTGNASSNIVTLLPSIEYNFNPNFGLLLSSWFTVAGKNTPNFSSLIITFNVYY